ncbi:hypothetical protein [Paenibacillus agricola]|uniref:DUF4352 domain-containing protein n=1 Tax=Paenibacillus agricola TaxID=2716264 RepID=A0ABX0J4D0_9BACL|nr:hypothetical protein [Paenibacillus agricola]NHN30681.1 hypothetical protein [Paenibacillus agricola]
MQSLRELLQLCLQRLLQLPYRQRQQKQRQLYKGIPKGLLLLMAAAILLGPIPPSVFAEGEIYQRDELDSTLQLEGLSLGSDSSIQLKSATIIQSVEGRVLLFTMSVANGGSSKLSFLDYWIRVFDSGGAEYKADLLLQDKLKKEVPAGQRVDFSFYAPVNDSTVLESLAYRVIRWDYTSAELEQTLGEIQFPEAASALWVPTTATKTVQMSGMPVELEVVRWAETLVNGHTSPKLALRLLNKGKASIRMVDYQYVLRTSSGAMYPLEIVPDSDKQSLQPDMAVELQLKANELPAPPEGHSWDLVVTQPLVLTADTKLQYPIAALRISTEPPVVPMLGGSVDYTNSNGTYTFHANQVDRLPWEDQDILTADVSLSHPYKEALPYPELIAYFELDGGVKVEAKVVPIDRAVGVPPTTSVHVKLVSKIPYTYPFASAKLVLKEQTSESASEDIAQFQLPPSRIDLPTLAFGDSQRIVGAGRAASYAPREIHTFTDGVSNLFEVQVEVSNLEKRSNAIPKLVAFFKTADDSMYPTKIREIKQKLNPQGKALLSFSNKLPKDLDVTNMKLVIGESITDQRISGPDDKADAYMNVVQMELPIEHTTVSPILKELVFYPYTISLSNINTWLDRKELRVNFQYKLVKDSYYETSNEGSKLIIQFEDGNGNVHIDEVFYLETAPEDEDKRLSLGEHDYRITRQDESLVFKIESLKQFKLHIYHEFQGKRKLLGSQTMNWFGVTE